MPETSRPGRNLASSNIDARPLRGLPANIGHESDPFGVLLADMSAKNADALVLSATGRDLDSDLTVTEGHKHNNGYSRILWHQLLSWDHAGDEEGFGSSGNREGAIITNTSSKDIAVLPLKLPTILNGAGPTLTSYYLRLRFRFRVSNPSVGSSAYTTLYLKVVLFRPDMGDYYEQFQIAAQSSAAHTLSNEWLEKVITVHPDNIDDSGGNLQLLISGWIDTAGDKATLWETQVVAE